MLRGIRVDRNVRNFALERILIPPTGHTPTSHLMCTFSSLKFPLGHTGISGSMEVGRFLRLRDIKAICPSVGSLSGVVRDYKSDSRSHD